MLSCQVGQHGQPTSIQAIRNNEMGSTMYIPTQVRKFLVDSLKRHCFVVVGCECG